MRRSDCVFFAFFFHLAVNLLLRDVAGSWRIAAALGTPAVLLSLAWADAGAAGRSWSIVRDWVPAPLLVMAYWSADWVPGPPRRGILEHAFIDFDRILLNDWGLRTAVERLAPVGPTILELAYLLVYCVPPLLIAGFYLKRERRRIDDFLFPFLLGTLTTYALLPYFPSEGPRFVFPGADLPSVDILLRRWNLWILHAGDIHSSVFPSGHVTVAFSAAFAMLLAAPERRIVGWGLMTVAVLVLIDTVYARYHYAADGIAGVAISATAFGCVLAVKACTAGKRT